MAEGVAHLSKEREAVRVRAVAEAKRFIESHLGSLTSDDTRQLLRLLSVDHYNGSDKANRFSPGFSGALANDIAANTDALNR